VKSSVSIALFLLLSGFFLTTLLGAIEHSRKLLGLAGAFLVVIVCVIVFLTPVQLPPSWRLGFGDDDADTAADTTTTTALGSPITTPATSSTGPGVTSNAIPAAGTDTTHLVTPTATSSTVSAVTTEASGARSQ
jgi:hypothetical protein